MVANSTKSVRVHAGKEETVRDHVVPAVHTVPGVGPKPSSWSTLVPVDFLNGGVRPRPSSMLVRPTSQRQTSLRRQGSAVDPVEGGSLMIDNARAYGPEGPPQANPRVKGECHGPCMSSVGHCVYCADEAEVHVRSKSQLPSRLKLCAPGLHGFAQAA